MTNDNNFRIDLTLIIVIVAILSGCLNTLQNFDIISDTEYEVYSAFFLYKYPNPADTIVISQLTYNNSIMVCYKNSLIDSKPQSVDCGKIDWLDDYLNKNAKVYKLENKFSIPNKVILFFSNFKFF